MDFNLTTIVNMVDRTTLGGGEIKIDGNCLVFARGEMKKAVPGELIAWLYQHEKEKVWTVDGQYVCRYAVEHPPQWLLDVCGPEVADCTPIELDRSRIEGWDTRGVPRDTRTKVIAVNGNPQDLRERVGGGERVAAGVR